VGGTDDDTLKGMAGDDTLTGGAGNDRLEGGAGNDTYIYNFGNGRDTISDNLGTNALQLGAGIEPSGVKFTRDGTNHLNAVFVMPDGGRVTVENWFNSLGTYQLSEIRFADGTVWTKANINSQSAILEGTAQGDTINGTAGNDIIYGYDGNDTINGQDGNDILIGGPGDDFLRGWNGDNTYIWNTGDGSDTIYSQFGGEETLQIGDGVDPTALSLLRSGNNLTISLNDGSGSVLTLQAWYSGSSYQLSKIIFAEGTEWTKGDIGDIASGKAPFSTAPIRQSSEAMNTQDSSGAVNSGGGCDAGVFGLALILIPAVWFGKAKKRG
jgi:Ca2+-binding RTX toxin-like protein